MHARRDECGLPSSSLGESSLVCFNDGRTIQPVQAHCVRLDTIDDVDDTCATVAIERRARCLMARAGSAKSNMIDSSGVVFRRFLAIGHLQLARIQQDPCDGCMAGGFARAVEMVEIHCFRNTRV